MKTIKKIYFDGGMNYAPYWVQCALHFVRLLRYDWRYARNWLYGKLVKK